MILETFFLRWFSTNLMAGIPHSLKPWFEGIKPWALHFGLFYLGPAASVLLGHALRLCFIVMYVLTGLHYRILKYLEFQVSGKFNMQNLFWSVHTNMEKNLKETVLVFVMSLLDIVVASPLFSPSSETLSMYAALIPVFLSSVYSLSTPTEILWTWSSTSDLLCAGKNG